MQGMDGVKTRTRICNNPKNGGNNCTGEDQQSEICGYAPGDTSPRVCPIDGVFNEWSEWGSCSLTCGHGTRMRTRQCQDPKFGGVPCTPDEEGYTDKHEEPCDTGIFCPVPATMSQWSEWSCDQECYFATRERETSESRSRNCTDGNPRHPTENCEDLATTNNYNYNNETEQHHASRPGPCKEVGLPSNHEDHIKECPGLFTLLAWTCGNSYAGSRDNVKVHLRNGDNDQCTTNWVTDSEGYWSHSTQKKWANAAKLGTCRSSGFQPLKGLEKGLYFRLEVNSWGWNLLFDDLKICGFEARFGNTDLRGSSRWSWSVTEANGVWNDDHRDGLTWYTKWIRMDKI